MTPGLNVIDGTPTAIAKFIREEEAKKHLCPKCGSEMEKWLLCHDPDVWHCRKCGHEEKVGEKPMPELERERKSKSWRR